MLNTLTIPKNQKSILELEKEIQTEKNDSAPAQQQIDSPENNITHQGGNQDPWTKLKIKLNIFQTRAPLLIMAINNSQGEVNNHFDEAKKLNAHHKETTQIIAKELWPNQSIPPSVIGVIGKGIAESMQSIWSHKINTETFTPQKTAGLFLQFMPEMDMPIESIFGNQNHIPSASLIDAKNGANLAAKMMQTIGQEPDALKVFYTNEKSIPEIAASLNESIRAESKEIAKAVSTEDPIHQDIAYQSTLKTIGGIYEQSLMMAARKTYREIRQVKEKTHQEKEKYIEHAESIEFGQVHDSTIQNATELINNIYQRKQAEHKTDNTKHFQPGMR